MGKNKHLRVGMALSARKYWLGSVIRCWPADGRRVNQGLDQRNPLLHWQKCWFPFNCRVKGRMLRDSLCRTDIAVYLYPQTALKPIGKASQQIPTLGMGPILTAAFKSTKNHSMWRAGLDSQLKTRVGCVTGWRGCSRRHLFLLQKETACWVLLYCPTTLKHLVLASTSGSFDKFASLSNPRILCWVQHWDVQLWGHTTHHNTGRRARQKLAAYQRKADSFKTLKLIICRRQMRPQSCNSAFQESPKRFIQLDGACASLH